MIAKVALENTEERTWLKMQRRQLKIKGVDLSGPYTLAEIDLYKSRHPKLGIEFSHFPQDSREACKRKRDDELLDNEDIVDLKSMDIVMGVNSMICVDYSQHKRGMLS